MLLTLNKLVIFVSLIVVFTSCSSKKYYSSNTYKKSNTYAKIKNQKMKNSKAMQRATMRSYVVHGKRYYPNKKQQF